jgi:hypothetical protein
MLLKPSPRNTIALKDSLTGTGAKAGQALPGFEVWRPGVWSAQLFDLVQLA